MKKRLDVVLVERGLAESRSQAQALVLAGRVPGFTKAGTPVDEAAELAVDTPPRFVSRGGEKLANALEHFELDVTGEDCLDIGASTGGFTDCLLQAGAARVCAVDVGYGQLHLKLRQRLSRQGARANERASAPGRTSSRSHPPSSPATYRSSGSTRHSLQRSPLPHRGGAHSSS